MFKLTKIFTILFAFLLFMGGCDKLIYDDPIDEEHKPAVYLSVSYGGASKLRSSNNEPDGPTINVDGTDYEDRVHDLAMLVFESGDNGKLVSHFFDNDIPNTAIEKKFVVKLTPGTLDFYFVANMNWADVTAVKTKAQMEAYLKKLTALDEDLYQGAKADKGFPMARVYKNKVIDKGGTLANPTPFIPDDNDSQVLLRRVVAQLEVNISTSDLPAVKDIYYRNAFSQYSLTAQEPTYPTPLYYKDNQDVSLVDQGNGKYWLYVPEALMAESTAWGTGDHKPVNYFVIETMDNTRYDIPILTYGDAGDPVPGGNYLKFAKGELTEKPDYNVYRNRRYVYTVKNIAKSIEVDYTIDPWKLVHTSLYMGYGYNVSIEGGKVTIANTIDACPPHEVKLVAEGGADVNGQDEVTYTDDTPFNGHSYNLNNIPDSGDYLKVYYNDKLVKVFSK